MQICGQMCANILLESTSFSRTIAPVQDIPQYLLICGKKKITFWVLHGQHNQWTKHYQKYDIFL